MERADSHLEATLEELNDRVNDLELSGDRTGLLEALVNRGIVLSMMEYRTSAIDDLETAAGLAEELESDGIGVDAGTAVKIHVTLGSLVFDQDGDPVEEYYLASLRLRDLGPGSNHYDARSIVRMCISVCEDLIDSEHPEDCGPFLDKGMEVASGHDPWSLNRMMELHALSAEAADSMNDVAASVEEFAVAISIGTELLERGVLEDTERLVLLLAMKADGDLSLGDTDQSIADLTAAVGILEGMMENHMLQDKEALISLHHDLAGVLLKAGRVEEAEKHMIRAMEIGIVGYTGSLRDDQGSD